MAVPRLYTPLSLLALRATAGVIGIVTVCLGLVKILMARNVMPPGPASTLVPPDVLLGVGVAEILLGVLLVWRTAAFYASLLLIADFANHILALVAVGRPLAAALLLLLVNVATIVLWSWRPKFLGGDPRRRDIALVD